MSKYRMFHRKLSSVKFFFQKRKIVVLYKLFLGDEWLELSVKSIAPYVDYVVFVISDIPWGNLDVQGDELEPHLDRLKQFYGKKLHIIHGSWDKQLDHVRAGLSYIKNNLIDATHCIYADSDEVYTEKQIKKLIRLSKHPLYFNRQIRWNYKNYFKDIYHIIWPIKYPLAMVMFPLRSFTEFVTAREVNYGIVEMKNEFYEHFAYVRKNDDAIRRKIEAHRETEAILGDWYQEVWLKWTPEMKSFHPTEPSFWEGVKTVKSSELPEGVEEAFMNWNK